MRLNKIEIVDWSGKIIDRFDNLSNQINVSALRKGIYLVKIDTGKGVATRKFTKE